ncbi:hypothetical protein HDU82_002961 [Entophlyctis luteolus]|nr:hypothetical protein HDU82_002961 [Entophlyctis luteolus]
MTMKAPSEYANLTLRLISLLLQSLILGIVLAGETKCADVGSSSWAGTRHLMPVPSYEEAVGYYIATQHRQPPRLFRAFYEYATGPAACDVLGAASLARSFDHLPQRITPQLIGLASRKRGTSSFVVERRDDAYSTQHSTPTAAEGTAPSVVVRDIDSGIVNGRWSEYLAPALAHLPDGLRIVINRMDQPLVRVPGAPTACFNASADMHDEFSLWLRQHAHFHTGHSEETDDVVPVFSAASVPACFADIVAPMEYALMAVEDHAPETDIPWDEKIPTALWRGSSTDGKAVADPDQWATLHRHRLVMLSCDLEEKQQQQQQNASNPVLVDAKFTRYYYPVSAEVHDALAQRLGATAPSENFMTPAQQYAHRYLVVADGATFAERLQTYLRESRSLIFRGRVFADWTDHWLRAGEHYVSVRLDWADLEAAVEWARAHDSEARAVAEAGYAYARRRLRYEDMQCHMFALLMEYDDRLSQRHNLTAAAYDHPSSS